MIKIDFWYNEREIAFADYTFYPNEGIYRGNVYDSKGNMIGDYSSTDSVAIEKMFPGIFGN